MNPPSTKSRSGALFGVATALLDEAPMILLTAGSVLEHFHFHCRVADSASRIESNSAPVIIFFPLMLHHFPLTHSLRPLNSAVAASTRCSRMVFLA